MKSTCVKTAIIYKQQNVHSFINSKCPSTVSEAAVALVEQICLEKNTQ